MKIRKQKLKREKTNWREKREIFLYIYVKNWDVLISSRELLLNMYVCNVCISEIYMLYVQIHTIKEHCTWDVIHIWFYL